MYELNKLGLDDWNAALDNFLIYKRRNPSKDFDTWYTFKTKQHSINNKSNSKNSSPPPEERSEDDVSLLTKLFDILDIEVTKNEQIEETYEERILREAETFARRAHAGQYRDNGEPFINHIENVVEIIKANKDSNKTESIVVAWLHDVLIKTPYTIDHLYNFPWMTKRIVAAIEELPMSFFESYEEYVDRLKNNDLIWVVKLAKLMALMGDDPTEDEQFEIDGIADELDNDL